MPIYEVALGIVLTTMVGMLFVSPIYLFERYILWESLDEYIDSIVIKVVACAVTSSRSIIDLYTVKVQSYMSVANEL